MNLLRFFSSKTSTRRKVFVSYSSIERLLANRLGDWLKAKLNVDCFCGELPEAIDAGADWYERITKAASGSDECLLLLSPDSLNKGWIHFEAGVALGASIQKTSSPRLTIEELKQKRTNIVPVLYGGIQMSDIPSNLSRFQCLDLMDKPKFNTFAQRVNQSSVDCADFHDDLLKSMSSAVRHQLFHGGSSLVLPDDEIRTKSPANQTFNKEGQNLLLKRTDNGECLVAIRLRFFPRAVGDVQKWKFGVELRNPMSANPRVFQFHAGCHDGYNTWSLYSRSNQIVPISIPSDFKMDVPATIQLWLSKDGRLASCVGIGSDGQRQVLLNPQGDRRWKLDDTNWTTAIIAGWADGSKYRVDLDNVEIDLVKV